MRWSSSARSDAAMQGALILLRKVACRLSEEEQKRLFVEFAEESRLMLVKFEAVTDHMNRRINSGN